MVEAGPTDIIKDLANTTSSSDRLHPAAFDSAMQDGTGKGQTGTEFPINKTANYMLTTVDAFLEQVDACLGKTRAGHDQLLARGMLSSWRHKPLEPLSGTVCPPLPWNSVVESESHRLVNILIVTDTSFIC